MAEETPVTTAKKNKNKKAKTTESITEGEETGPDFKDAIVSTVKQTQKVKAKKRKNTDTGDDSIIEDVKFKLYDIKQHKDKNLNISLDAGTTSKRLPDTVLRKLETKPVAVQPEENIIAGEKRKKKGSEIGKENKTGNKVKKLSLQSNVHSETPERAPGFSVDPVTPVTQIRSAFKSVPITPKPNKFKITPITPVQTQKEQKKNLKRKKIDIKEPIRTLPKPVWATESAGDFNVTEIHCKKINLSNDYSSTDFEVTTIENPANKKRRPIHRMVAKTVTNANGISSSSLNFKNQALFNRNIQRVDSGQNFREQQRRKFTK